MIRNLERAGALLLTMICFVILSSCGDDEKPANKITVDGTTFKITNGYITSEADDEVSEHIVILTSDGVTVDPEEGEISGTGDVVFFYLASEKPTLVKGTYELTSSPDYGDLIFFQIGHTVNGAEPEEFYYGSEGNVKVTSAKGDKFTFKFNFSEVILEDEDSSDEIDATIKGYFSGTLESIDLSSGRMAEKINTFRLKK